MATLAAPDVPSLPPLTTWAEICATYPDQYILVDDAVFHDGTIVSARVLRHEVRRIDRVRLMAKLRPEHPDVQDLWTGGETDGDRHFAWKLAMYRRGPG